MTFYGGGAMTAAIFSDRQFIGRLDFRQGHLQSVPALGFDAAVLALGLRFFAHVLFLPARIAAMNLRQEDFTA